LLSRDENEGDEENDLQTDNVWTIQGIEWRPKSACHKKVQGPSRPELPLFSEIRDIRVIRGNQNSAKIE